MGVDAARTDQSDDVQTAVRSCLVGGRGDEGRTLEEGAVGDRGVDPGQVLEDRASGAEVQMPDLGVAHLAGRQTDGVLGRAEGRVRPVPPEPAPDRHRGRRDRVGRGVVADPEAIEDDEDDGPRPAGRSLAHPVTAAPRAAAVNPARATIPAISSGLSDAPPTSAPSIAGSARNSAMLAEVTLPPYRTGTSAAPASQPSRSRTSRIASAIADASAPLAFRPVPIAQTGS